MRVYSGKMKITKQLLVKYNACRKGISFFERNFPKSLFPDGLDLNKIRVSGDLGGYVEWLKNLPAFAEHGCLIRLKSSDGTVCKYSDHGNLIKTTHPDGIVREYSYVYDIHGNIIEETRDDGVIRKYDDHGNLIKSTFRSGMVHEYSYVYDIHGNIIEETYCEGTVYKYLFEYDSKGRLVKADDLTIEYL